MRSKSDNTTNASGAAGEKRGSAGLTAEEQNALKERVRELKAAGRRESGRGKEDGEREVLARIAEMQESDQAMATRIHAIIKDCAPDLLPKTWYGMPAYGKDGNVVCFFQSAQKFKTRYATLGFSDKAMLDDGEMWPTAYAIGQLTAGAEARIRELVRKAVG